ncbi:MFS transporter [Tepidanaerobacter syntrophicus]|uniref:Glycoside/pentoside/hexuronide:cation symporter, GPH family n=1 Tax=Tepidanaerobacter syntrophicus TaxID=224999 RepID=A0A0U9HBK6_9FIRM|nr:MFS transporter [Tepidanaerobacter syntrophicus]GAQ24165.1 glycoside/pentoside/hexuronide:cation symporter, GPH family [Tepidanaerobacter syntrophicus]
MKQEASKKVTSKLINSYGFVSFAFNLMMMVAVTYYAYFLTDVAVINAALMGTILLIARICDMISVPITGGIIQSVQLKWGQYRSWILLAPPFTCLFFILMFTNPDFDPITKGIFLGTCYVIAHICVNFAFNAHAGLIAVLGKTPQERMTLSQRNVQFMMASSIVFSLTCMPLVEFFGKGDQGRGFLFTVVIFAIIQVLGYWNLFRQSEGYDYYDPNKKMGKGGIGISPAEMFQQLFTNSQLLTLFTVSTLQALSMFGISALLSYYYKYVIGNLDMISIHLFGTAVCSFIGSLIAPYIIRKLGKKNTYLLTTIVNVIVFTIVRLTGGRNPVIFISLASLGALIGASGMAMGAALYSDTAEYGKWKTGKDATAFIMSMSAMPTKIGVALSGAVVGYGLAAVGYDPTVGTTPELVNSIVDLTTSIPIICGVISFILFAMFYKLTDEKVMEVMGLNTQNE